MEYIVISAEGADDIEAAMNKAAQEGFTFSHMGPGNGNRTMVVMQREGLAPIPAEQDSEE